MLKQLIVAWSVLAICLPAVRAQDVEAAGEPGLAAWWKLDETSGTTAADASGNGNVGTLKNGPTWVKGFNGNAVKLDGKDDYVAINKLKYNQRGLTEVTVATWIRTANGGDQYIASFDRDAYWQLVINGGSADEGQVAWLVTTDAGFAAVRSTARIDDGNWHHVAAVFDNGKLAIYIDGVVKGNGTSGRTFGNGATRFGFLGIGSLADKVDGTKATTNYLNGELDDARIYSRALTKTQIEQLAFRGPTNDMCANAQPIGEVDKLPFDTRQATPDGVGAVIKSPNLWYKYTPSAAGKTTVSLAGSQFDTMLAVYRGAQVNPGQDRLIASNDDFNGLTSQLTFDAAAGQVYLIEVGGFDGFTGQGLLTVSLAAVTPAEFDLGDAPDGSNNYGKRMTAYTVAGQASIQANFPTVFNDRDGRVHGPIHMDPLAVAHLGTAVTFETEADKGTDEDPSNNINPATDQADKDGADDGVVLPLKLPHGEYSAFEYVVSVIKPNQELWVNVWFDWNRDGDWDDDASNDPQLVAGGRKVSEWAVRNQLLYGLPTGTHRIMTPGFLAWHLDKGPEKVWMRITLAEKPWKGGAYPGTLGNGGSGPVEGYEIGETEDYLITPQAVCSLCEDRTGDGKLNFDDLMDLMSAWLESCTE